jgi:hypothetical protein
MVIVVVVDFRMAIKTEGNAVFKAVVTAKVLWFEVVRLNSDPTRICGKCSMIARRRLKHLRRFPLKNSCGPSYQLLMS